MEITGILTKQGQKMKTWRRRHFELHSHRLCYYSYDGGPMKGEFLIDDKTTVQISHLRRHGFSLVQQHGKTLNMFADNAIDKERWMNCLSKIINQMKASNLQRITPPSPPPSTINHTEIQTTKIESISRDDSSTISVHIIQAKDLAPKGSTDTYAKVIVDADYATTRIVKKELSPIWDETFSFLWTTDLRFVRIEVWNDDPMHSSRDNFLGVIYIPILSLQPTSTSTPVWYKLGKRSSRSNISGEIKVAVRCHHRPPDPYVMNVLRDVQKIPELQIKATDLLLHSFHDESSLVFPTLLPPLETELCEDLSLRVTLKPTLDKSTTAAAASVEGILLLTNYRIIFVSHSRIAFAEESLSTSNGELTCSIPLAMVVSLSIQPAHYDARGTSQYEDAITLATNDSKVCVSRLPLTVTPLLGA
jgi:hypothetical protein